MSQSHVPANIRAEATRRGKNQTHIAGLLGITRQAVSRRFAGHVDFRLAELEKIADYLGVSVADLLNDHTTKAAS